MDKDRKNKGSYRGMGENRSANDKQREKEALLDREAHVKFLQSLVEKAGSAEEAQGYIDQINAALKDDELNKRELGEKDNRESYHQIGSRRKKEERPKEENSNVIDVTPRPPPDEGIIINQSSINFSFKVSVETNEDEDKIASITAGERCVHDNDDEGWKPVIALEDQAYIEGGCFYMVWTNSTPSTAGSWSDAVLNIAKPLYGTPPTQSPAIQVIKIATTTSSGIIYHRIGDIRIYDIRSQCE